MHYPNSSENVSSKHSFFKFFESTRKYCSNCFSEHMPISNIIGVTAINAAGPFFKTQNQKHKCDKDIENPHNCEHFYVIFEISNFDFL